MLNKVAVAGFVAPIILAVSPAHATVVLLTSSGQIATSYLNDFETVKDSGPVTFNPNAFLITSGNSTGGVTSSGNLLLASTAGAPITATLSGYYNAVGLVFGNDDTCCAASTNTILSVFDGLTFLGSVSVVANMNDFADQFIGLSSTSAFNRVTIDYSSPNLTRVIDDFRLGVVASDAAVPEPATWAMMLVGFGMIGFGMRRRQRQTVRYNFA